MRSAILVVALLSASCATVTFPAGSYPADSDVVLLSSEQAKELDCYWRPGPPRGRLFAPSIEEIAQVEASLPSLRDRFGACRPSDSERTIRQYVGITTLFGRYVYVNVNPAGVLEMLEGSLNPDPRWTAACLAHGEGDAFWAALFELNESQFVRVYRSGEIYEGPGLSCKPAA
jgi:hypothetical protein